MTYIISVLVCQLHNRQKKGSAIALTRESPGGKAGLIAGGTRHELARRVVLELGVQIGQGAAAIVAHRDRTVGGERDLDAAGVARDRLIHGVVEHLGEEMVNRRLVGATDVHGEPAAHGLEAREDLDVFGRVVGRGARGPPGGAVEEVGRSWDGREYRKAAGDEQRRCRGSIEIRNKML